MVNEKASMPIGISELRQTVKINIGRVVRAAERLRTCKRDIHMADVSHNIKLTYIVGPTVDMPAGGFGTAVLMPARIGGSFCSQCNIASLKRSTHVARNDGNGCGPSTDRSITRCSCGVVSGTDRRTCSRPAVPCPS